MLRKIGGEFLAGDFKACCQRVQFVITEVLCPDIEINRIAEIVGIVVTRQEVIAANCLDAFRKYDGSQFAADRLITLVRNVDRVQDRGERENFTAGLNLDFRSSTRDTYDGFAVFGIDHTVDRGKVIIRIGYIIIVSTDALNDRYVQVGGKINIRCVSAVNNRIIILTRRSVDHLKVPRKS